MAERRKANPEFGRRLSKAKADWNHAHYPEKISDEEIGIRVGRAMKRADGAYSYQAVGQWLKGREPDSLDVIKALATVLGCDAAWLAFGPIAEEPVLKKKAR